MERSIGLSTNEALEKLQHVIQNELDHHCNGKKKKSFMHISKNCIPVNIPSIIIFLFIAVCLVIMIPESDRLTDSLITELVVFVFLLVFTFLLNFYEYHYENDEVERAIKNFSNNLYDPSQKEWSPCQYPNTNLLESETISLIWVYRDDKIINLPSSLLVPGDIIILGPSRVAPADCKKVTLSKHLKNEYNEFTILEAGEIFNPRCNESVEEITLLERQTFEVIEPPVRNMIKTYLQNCSIKNSSKLFKKVSRVADIIEYRVMWIVLILSFLVNAMRSFLLDHNVESTKDMLCYIQAISVLPLLSLTISVLWYVISLYGSARLLCFFETAVQRANETEKRESEEIQEFVIEIKLVIKTMWKMIRGDTKGIPRTVNLMHTLGSITVFCCVDKEGILCEKIPIPEKVGFFKKKQQNNIVKNPGEDNLFYIGDDADLEKLQGGSIEKDGAVINELEILSISHDPASKDRMQFDDVLWEESLSSLKAIGANMILNSPCVYPYKYLQSQDISGYLSLQGNDVVLANKKSCFCGFSNHIGVKESMLGSCSAKQHITAFLPMDGSENEVTPNNFLSMVKETHVPFLQSIVNYDSVQGVHQLLTQGSADLILDLCSEFWNGEEICELGEVERKKALNFFQRMNITGHCITFAYRPVFENTSDQNVYLKFKKDQLRLKTGSNFDELPFKGVKKKANMEDFKCHDLLKPIPSLCQESDTHVRSLNDQIFLGMVTLQQVLKEDVVLMIEQLDQAGIRFIHFSSENELLSRVFCQRLGLETGWNCHISLTGENVLDEWSSSAVSDSCPLLPEDDQYSSRGGVRRSNTDTSISLRKLDDETDCTDYETYDELYFMSNRSKLPKGIQHIRSHLEDVDDVPLLVPLFTDCNPKAVCEMIKIMQEYDEIVCCIGSSLNMNNFKIFTQSDLSIAIEPAIIENCIQKKSAAYGDNAGAKESDAIGGPLDIAKMLNSLSCSLSCKRTDNFPIAAIICEARRLSVGHESCLLFVFSSHLMLTLMMLLSSLFLLVPPFSGIQILWLVCVIIPTIGASLVGNPSKRGLMKMLTGKRRKAKIKELASTYFQLFIPIGLNILFIMLLVYPWMLNIVCTENRIVKTECHWFIGPGNSSTYWDYWYKELRSGFSMSQDLLLFYVVVTLIILSASYVDRRQLLWKFLPFRNIMWCFATAISLILQIIYTVISLKKWNLPLENLGIGLQSIHPGLYCGLLLWLIVLMVVSEIVKHKNIRAYIRFQKRERLKFDTKLGMNSPV